jgi:hypothetical protein
LTWPECFRFDLDYLYEQCIVYAHLPLNASWNINQHKNLFQDARLQSPLA